MKPTKKIVTKGSFTKNSGYEGGGFTELLYANFRMAVYSKTTGATYTKSVTHPQTGALPKNDFEARAFVSAWNGLWNGNKDFVYVFLPSSRSGKTQTRFALGE